MCVYARALSQLTAVLPDPEWVKLEHPDNDPDADDAADWGELLVSVQVRHMHACERWQRRPCVSLRGMPSVSTGPCA